MGSSRRYMSSTSLTVAGDQKRSAMAAMRGQMRESMVSGPTNSLHMQASPPSTRAVCAASSPASAAMGSTR